MNLSIVLPFYHKLEEFKQTLPHNKEFFVEGMELIIPIDEPDSEPALKEFLDSQNLQIPYVLKSNMETHDWRNPAKAINVGIKLSTRERIVVMSPETLCVSNLYKELYDRCTLHNFTLGRVGWVSLKSIERHGIDSLNSLFDRINSSDYYGSICVFKQSLELVQGYNEAFIKWGGDDDELRQRLTQNHIEPLRVDSAKALHIQIKHTKPLSSIEGGFNPNLAIPFSPQPEWGTSF
jgi:hypothetical protein